jgi:hypothetical protein
MALELYCKKAERGRRVEK